MSASHTFAPDPRFPVGTVLSVYPGEHRRMAPGPAATTTGTVNSARVVTFTGLAYDTRYTAAATVSGQWLTTLFTTSEDPSGDPASLADITAISLAGLGADTTGTEPADEFLTGALAQARPVDLGGPENTYKIATANIALAAGAKIIGHGATLDFSSAPYNAKLFTAAGDAGTEVPLTVNTTLGASTLTVASHPLEAGDLVKVGATDVFDAGRTDTRVGEFAYVDKTTATVITLRSPLAAGPYTTANTATVQKIIPHTGLRLQGFKIRGAGLTSTATTTLATTINDSATTIVVADATNISAQQTITIDGEHINIDGKSTNTLTVYASGEGRGSHGSVAAAHTSGATVTIASLHMGLDLDLCQDVQLVDVHFDSCFLMGVEAGDSLDVTADRCTFTNSRRWKSGYGIQFTSASQDCKVTKSRFTQVRHSMTTGGATTTGRKGIARRILFDGNTVRDTYGGTGDAIDTHAASEDITIVNNHVFDAGGAGINFECPSGTIANNRITRTGNLGIYFHNEATPDSDIAIQNNRVRYAGTTGIQATTGEIVGAGAEQESISVTGNRVYSPGGKGIYVGSAQSAIHFDGAVVANNVVKNPTSEGIKILRCDWPSITGNTLRGIPTATDGLSVDTSTYVAVNGNVVQHNAVSQTGIQFTDVDGGTIGGNVITGPNVGITIDNNCTYVCVAGNEFHNTSSPVSLGTGTGNRFGENVFDPATLSVASAATITFPPHLNYAVITGTTGITSITASWPGRRISLRFAAVLTVTDGSNLKMAGDFVTTADDTISYISDGTNWFETGRSVN